MPAERPGSKEGLPENESVPKLPPGEARGDQGFVEGAFKMIQEGEREGNKAKEVYGQLQFAKFELKRILGVDKLSTIEEYRLRKIVERCVDNEKRDKKAPEVAPEAAAIWLFELYGIAWRDIPRLYYINGKRFNAPDNVEDRFQDEQLEAYEKEGKLPESVVVIPEDFKEYLRRLREKAHQG